MEISTLWTTREKCAVCGHPLTNAHEVLAFERVPLANGYATPDLTLPMTLLSCVVCGHLQLREIVEPSILFAEYAYQTGVNKPQRHFAELAGEVDRFVGGLAADDTILDIGANDGSLLRAFTRGKPYGVDPALGENVPGFRGFWLDADIARAKVILATHTFAHLPELHSNLEKIADTLMPDGVFVIHVPWARDLLVHNQYDTLYHEHQHWFTVRALKNLYAQHELSLARVDYLPTVHGGTIRVWATKDARSVPELSYLVTLEEEASHIDFAAQVQTHRTALHALLPPRFEAFGAAAKGIMLCSIAGIAPQKLYDDTPTKVGRIAPGTRLRVAHGSEVADTETSVMLITAWNHAEAITARVRGLGYTGKLAVPFPVPRYLSV